MQFPSIVVILRVLSIAPGNSNWDSRRWGATMGEVAGEVRIYDGRANTHTKEASTTRLQRQERSRVLSSRVGRLTRRRGGRRRMLLNVFPGV